MKTPAHRRLIALSASTALLVPLSIGGFTLSAPAAPKIPGLTDSAALEGEVVASGTLFTADGALAPAGTIVRLSAWPSPEVLADLAIGESVKITPVGYAVTEADGGFDLRISDTDLANRYASATTGLTDLELSAVVDGKPVIFNMPLDVDASVNHRASTASLDTSFKNIELMPVTGTADVLMPVDSDGQISVEKSCTGTKVSDYSPWVTVIQGFAPSSVKMTVGYSSSSSSTLGVGVSTSGSYGTYSAGGTSSVSSTATIGFAPVTGPAGKHWKTQFKYSKFRYYCYTQNPSTTYQVRPVAWIGGTLVSNATAPAATYCSTYRAGDYFLKNSTDATTFSGGVAISGSIGVNLSAKTGYSTNARIRFDFSATRQLCGTSAFPPYTAGRLVAKL